MTNVTTLPHRIRAGAPAPVDTRQQCRLSSEVIGELIQAGAHRRNALAQHTSTPPEREYEATAGEDALICGVVAFLCIAVPLAAYLLTR